MRVRCIANKGAVLPTDLGYFPEAEFDIEIGKSYVVYGMCFRRHEVKYLINPGDEARPNWYPVNLFEIENSKLPTFWEFSFVPEHQEYGVPGIWGYEELARSPEHFDGLVERDPAAIAVFLINKRRTELEESQ
jgi:hypothetical protein